ncbi:type II toxin-antitoxin system PemK/MazF family toxin [Sphingomonas endolithica]|uniref:type II toxin-antitoxin system PemK/MazF family toxin n=1 Tax=Sphingomonas endolithica TaxID=2972485 RepID=UPI0021AE9F76|nr:type II toxin-antitoxin system PemK/MazF family toxin [Sphingomonas sp. ZFBP2030]
MKRGDIVSTIGKGDFSKKPRPRLIVQADAFNAHHPAFTVCPITSEISGDSLYRIPVSATDQTNLLDDSEIEIDLVQAIRRERVGGLIGKASDDTMILVDQALRRWLAL